MILLDGKLTAEKIKENIRIELDGLLASGQRRPHLAAILVGDDGASRTYIDSKERNSKAIGFDSTILRLPADTTQAYLIEKINEINNNPLIDGLLVQSPLPKHIDERLVTQTIAPTKDVDGFHDINMGKLAKGDDGFTPATPMGIMMMLEAYGIPTTGKHCVVIGRSNIVGRPMSILMSNNTPYGNCTVTLCHSKTQHIEHFTRQADILIVALGKPGFVKANMVKPDAVVIDVGITRMEDSNRKSGFYLKGDVDFEEVKEVASYLTPVPGGVGLMTIAALLSNTFKAYKLNNVG
jgi:methylenetetrahydrofolate dehydrogenase (NADP+)/methenyltetrahydrofolate cyclohydrolase